MFMTDNNGDKVTTKTLYELVEKLRGEMTSSLLRFEEKIDQVLEKLNQRIDSLDNKYVTQVEFWPVKTIVYAGAAIILIAVFSAIVYMVIKK